MNEQKEPSIHEMFEVIRQGQATIAKAFLNLSERITALENQQGTLSDQQTQLIQGHNTVAHFLKELAAEVPPEHLNQSQ